VSSNLYFYFMTKHVESVMCTAFVDEGGGKGNIAMNDNDTSTRLRKHEQKALSRELFSWLRIVYNPRGRIWDDGGGGVRHSYTSTLDAHNNTPTKIQKKVQRYASLISVFSITPFVVEQKTMGHT
jgi:hypothetical protein